MRRHVARRLLAVASAGVVLTAIGVVTRTASAESELAAIFDWSMPDRVVENPSAPGSVDLFPPTRAFLQQPNGWEVKLNACPSNQTGLINRYNWTITLGDGPREETSTGCQLDFVFPEEGRFPVSLAVTTVDGQTATTSKPVVVNDILVVSLGDSVASGEGNPDFEAFGGRPGGWQDRRCHRSGRSGPAQAALRLENADPHTSVTFLSLACSGASIADGILGGYKGQDPRGSEGKLDPQVVAANKLLCRTSPEGETCADKSDTRKIDALLLQVGANDLHFGTIVEECGYPRLAGLFEFCHTKDETILRLFNDLRELPGRYAEMAARLDNELNYSRVYLPEYFDPTSDDDGRICPGMDFIADDSPDGKLTHDEAVWAFNEVITPLNQAVDEAGAAANADGHRWNILNGPRFGFAQHGYCADDHWIVRYDESLRRQGDEFGTMHPNRQGHELYANTLLEAMRPLLSPGRPPVDLPPDGGAEPPIRGR